MANGQLYDRAFNLDNGNPASGAKLYSYIPGTVTPRRLYTDATLTTPATNPVVADAGGRIEAYADPSLAYDITVKTSDDATTLVPTSRLRSASADGADVLGFANVLGYGAVGDGVTDDTAAVHLARDAAGANGVVYFPPDRTYIIAGLQASVDDQTWWAARGGKLKLKNSSALNMVVVSGDRFKLIGELDGNRTGAPSGGMITVDPEVERPEFLVTCKNSASYAISTIDVADVIIHKGSVFSNNKNTDLFIRMVNAVADIAGPRIDCEIDRTTDVAATTVAPGIIVRGVETGGPYFSHCEVNADVELVNDPTNSACVGVEIKAVRKVDGHATVRFGGIATSFAEIDILTFTANCSHYAFYGFEAIGVKKMSVDVALDGCDAAGANSCLYPIALHDVAGYAKNKGVIRGSIKGATSTQSILLDSSDGVKLDLEVENGAANYVLYDEEEGNFELQGIYDGQTGGDQIVFSIDSPGRFKVSGRSVAFDNGGVALDIGNIGASSASAGDGFTITGGNTITRGAGAGQSFITDGMRVNDVCQLGSFATAGNNSRDLLITAVAATVLTVSPVNGVALTNDAVDTTATITSAAYPDYIDVDVVYEDSAGGGISTTSAGIAGHGEHIAAKGVGQFVGSSTIRGDVLNLKKNIIRVEGASSPEGVVTAGVGSQYWRNDGAAETLLYVKNSGTGNTGWAPVNTYSAGQVKGTATNDNAAAGYVGQIIESSVASGSAVSLTTVTAKTVTSISLTAGDWDVEGNVWYTAAAGTTYTVIAAAINTTADTLPTAPNGGAYSILNLGDFTTSAQNSLPTGRMRVSLASTTTVYLIGYSSFGVSTMGAYGYIGARRVR